MTFCITVLGPPVGFLVIVCSVDMGPLAISMLENGSGFAPAMGLDGAVCRSSSDLYGSEFDSEAVWPFDSVRGHREWSRLCQFNGPNCSGFPLRREEEHEGSIVLDLCIKLVEMIFWTPISMASYWL